VCRQALVSNLLELLEELVLLRRSYIVNDVSKDTKRALLAPLLHEDLLILMLRCVVVVRVLVLAADKHLANKVKDIRAIAEATIGGDKAIYVGKFSDCSVVI
jgi:hypothetical protein